MPRFRGLSNITGPFARSSVEEAPYIPPEVDPLKLHTDGLLIKDGNNDPYRLLAITVGWNELTKKDGLGSSCTSTPLNDETEAWWNPTGVSEMKDLGFNTIALQLLTFSRFSQSNGDVNMGFFTSYLDPWVNWNTAEGMRTVVKIQRFNPTPGSFDRHGWYFVPSWFYADYSARDTYAKVAETVLDFYDEDVSTMDTERGYYYDVLAAIALRYQDNPRVSIALGNEPMLFMSNYFDDDDHRLRCANGFVDIQEAAIDAMVATGYDGLFHVDRNYAFSTYSDGNFKVDRSNVIWEPHLYVSDGTTPNEWRDKLDSYQNFADNTLGQPLHAGEWGFNPSGMKDTYNLNTTYQTMFNHLETHNISHSIHGNSRIYGYSNWSDIGNANHFDEEEVAIISAILQR